MGTITTAGNRPSNIPDGDSPSAMATMSTPRKAASGISNARYHFGFPGRLVNRRASRPTAPSPSRLASPRAISSGGSARANARSVGGAPEATTIAAAIAANTTTRATYQVAPSSVVDPVLPPSDMGTVLVMFRPSASGLAD